MNNDFIKLDNFVNDSVEKEILSNFNPTRYTYEDEMFMYIISYMRYIKIFHPIYNFFRGKMVFKSMVKIFERVNKKKFYEGQKAEYFNNIVNDVKITGLKTIITTNLSMFPELKNIVKKQYRR